MPPPPRLVTLHGRCAEAAAALPFRMTEASSSNGALLPRQHRSERLALAASPRPPATLARGRRRHGGDGVRIERERTRRLAWEGVLNARDLGGYPAAGGRETRWGAVVRSDNLTPLTPAGRAALVRYGVRTIVDLRLPEEV